MDNEHFFIRGCIEIPIVGTNEFLIWGVWVSLSEANFNKAIEFRSNQELLEPMFGWLSTALPCYPDTVNLKALMHPRANGIRPYFELEPTDHPLAVESRIGVSYERVQQIAEELCINNSRPMITWPFEDPQNVAVITTCGIMKKERPILYVSHDEEDAMWQFLEGGTVTEEEARIIALKEIVDIDPSLMQLADLPLGWISWRESIEGQWLKAKR